MKHITPMILSLLVLAAFGVPDSFAATRCASERAAMRQACGRGSGAKIKACSSKTKIYNRCLSRRAKRAADNDVCLTVYAPVCAMTASGMEQTFSNSCYASLVSASVLYDGECLAAK